MGIEIRVTRTSVALTRLAGAAAASSIATSDQHSTATNAHHVSNESVAKDFRRARNRVLSDFAAMSFAGIVGFPLIALGPDTYSRTLFKLLGLPTAPEGAGLLSISWKPLHIDASDGLTVTLSAAALALAINIAIVATPHAPTTATSSDLAARWVWTQTLVGCAKLGTVAAYLTTAILAVGDRRAETGTVLLAALLSVCTAGLAAGVHFYSNDRRVTEMRRFQIRHFIETITKKLEAEKAAYGTQITAARLAGLASLSALSLYVSALLASALPVVILAVWYRVPLGRDFPTFALAWSALLFATLVANSFVVALGTSFSATTPLSKTGAYICSLPGVALYIPILIKSLETPTSPYRTPLLIAVLSGFSITCVYPALASAMTVFLSSRNKSPHKAFVVERTLAAMRIQALSRNYLAETRREAALVRPELVPPTYT